MSQPAFSLPAIPSPARLRTSLLRIPLATKALLAVIVLFWAAGLGTNVDSWASLAPDKVFQGGAHRLSTYPFVHIGLFHTLINLLAVTALLEKFESENGTLVAALLFSGPFSTFPGLLYTLLSKLLHIHTPVQGASVWVFILLTSQLYQTSKSTPFLSIPIPAFAQTSRTFTAGTPYSIPTALIPIILIVLTSVLLPHSSLLGHLCAALIGYGWGSGLLKFLAPPEKILRWVEDKLQLRIRLPSSYVSVDRVAVGRYGTGILPTTRDGAVGSGAANGAIGLVGTGDAGRRVGI